MKIAHAWLLAFSRPDGRWGIVVDREGRLILTQYGSVADKLAAALRRRGANVTPVVQTPVEIAHLMMGEGHGPHDMADHLLIIEQHGATWADAEFRAAEVAAAIPLDTVGDWRAQHMGQAVGA